MKILIVGIYNYARQRTLAFSIKGILYAIFHSRINKLKKADVLFICHDNHRTTYVGGLRYSPIIDTISDHMDSKFAKITLAAPFSKYYGKTCHGNVHMYNRILIIAYLKRLIFTHSLTITDKKTDPVVKAWSSILKLIQPKIIIGINPSLELCIAAKSIEIWIADIQHGILAPGNYYDLKKRANINQNGWPNTILCWDEFSKNYVDSNLAPHVQAMVVGNPASISKVSEELVCSAKDPTVKVNSKISVLVTLAGYFRKSSEGDLYFAQIGFPSSLINFIKTHGSFCIWNIRVHPLIVADKRKRAYVFSRLNYIFRDNPNVVWRQCNNETIYSALNRCSVHITYNSASARDAANVGIHTAVLDTHYDDVNLYFEDLIKEGTVTVCSAGIHQNFKEWIVNSSNKKLYPNAKKANAPIERRSLFKPFIAHIESIINMAP